MRSVTILVTAIWSTTAHSVVKGLRKQNEFDVTIVGTGFTDARTTAGTTFCDEYETVSSPEREREYVSDLKSVVEKYDVDVLFPLNESVMETLYGDDELMDDVDVLLSAPSTVERCVDKRLTTEFFEEIGVETPKSVFPESTDDDGFAELSYPLIVKPRFGVSSQDVYEIRHEGELPLVDRVEKPVVQEKVEGTEHTVDVLATDGELVCAVPRKRTVTGSGVSVRGETVDDDEMLSQVETIVSELELHGPANVQCFKSDDSVVFTEINPRFSGSLALTIEAGVNTPLYALRLLRDGTVGEVPTYDHVEMCRYWEETFWHGSTDSSVVAHPDSPTVERPT